MFNEFNFWGGFILGLTVGMLLVAVIVFAIMVQSDKFTKPNQRNKTVDNNNDVLEVIANLNQDRQHERELTNRDRQSERHANTAVVHSVVKLATRQNEMLGMVVTAYADLLPQDDLTAFRAMVARGYKLHTQGNQVDGFVLEGEIIPFPRDTTQTHVAAFREMQGVLELTTATAQG
jgi:hypothetical protein